MIPANLLRPHHFDHFVFGFPYKHSVHHLEQHRMAYSMSGTFRVPIPSWLDESVETTDSLEFL